ncbi:hypothetical protein ZWY2020_038690 [Hordeum vulgare]|nr:hypothetical protein ZWY2020_038690 [Hordeum vulgare]
MLIRMLNRNAEVMNKSAALAMNIGAAKGLDDVLKTNLDHKGTIKICWPSFFKSWSPEASPRRYVRRVDEVPPDDDGCDDALEPDGRGTGDDDPFDIPAKRTPVERLWRWRVAMTRQAAAAGG